MLHDICHCLGFPLKSVNPVNAVMAISCAPQWNFHGFPQFELTIYCTFEGARRFCDFLVYFNGGVLGNLKITFFIHKIRKLESPFTAEKITVKEYHLNDLPEVT